MNLYVLLLILCFIVTQSKKSVKERKAGKAYREGVKAQSNGDLNRAVNKYREALRFSTDGFHPMASWNLCHIYQYKAEAGPAIDVLKQALQALQSNGHRKIPSSVMVTNALSTNNAYQESVTYECGLHFYLGNMMSMQDHTILDARNHYVRVTELCPDFPDAHFRLAGVSSDLSKAIFRFEEAVRLRPDFLEAYVNLGSILKDAGRLNESVKAYDEAIRIRSDSAEALANRGVSLQAAGRLEEAIESYV